MDDEDVRAAVVEPVLARARLRPDRSECLSSNGTGCIVRGWRKPWL